MARLTRSPIKYRVEHLVHDRKEVHGLGQRLEPTRLATAFRSGRCPDRAFDRFLPTELRVVSKRYWTPLVVARRTAEWLDDLNIRSVVDVGSGAGKLCVAAALACDCRFTGVERRPRLIQTARTLAHAFDVDDRVTFVEGVFGEIATPTADAYYLFNPFGEYFVGSREYFGTYQEGDDRRRPREVAAVRDLLRRAPIETCVVTYNGFGGPVPDSYQQIRADDTMPNPLRLWRKTSAS